MIDIAHERLRGFLEKTGVEGSEGDWLKKHNIVLRAANGEEPIDSDHKFDRIIANLVLMATEDPLKMLENLHSMAA